MVNYFFNLDLTLVVGFYNAFHQLGSSHAVRNIADDERFFVNLFNNRPHPDLSAAFTFIVVTDIHAATCLKIGEYFKLPSFEVFNGRVDEFAEIMRKDFCCQSYGDTFGTLRQQQREFHGQGYRFILPAIITQLPVGGFMVESHFERELA